MRQFNMLDAKTQFSALILAVENGEEILIARSGRPVARILPLRRAPDEDLIGMDDGRIRIADDFDRFVPDGFDA